MCRISPQEDRGAGSGAPLQHVGFVPDSFRQARQSRARPAAGKQEKARLRSLRHGDRHYDMRKEGTARQIAVFAVQRLKHGGVADFQTPLPK